MTSADDDVTASAAITSSTHTVPFGCRWFVCFFLFTSVLFLFVDDVREPCVGVPCFGAKLGKHSVVGWSACRLVASVIIGSQLETEKAPASTQPTDPSGCVSLETTVGEIRLKTMYSV